MKPGFLKLLVVEDDVKTGQAIRRGLKLEGYEVEWANDGSVALAHLREEAYDALILDWMLPGVDGIGILRALEELPVRPPVLLLTARDSVEDRVLGLDSGADDYLVKPFAFAELLARVRVLLRRSKVSEASCTQLGDLRVDLNVRQVMRGGTELALTPREFDLLAYLMRYQGQVVTREMLVRDVWRETNRATSLNNVIDVHLTRLRKKVDEGASRPLIQTVRGVGFTLRELEVEG